MAAWWPPSVRNSVAYLHLQCIGPRELSRLENCSKLDNLHPQTKSKNKTVHAVYLCLRIPQMWRESRHPNIILCNTCASSWRRATDICGPRTSLLLEVRLYTDVNGATVGARLCGIVCVLWHSGATMVCTVMAIVRTKPTVRRRTLLLHQTHQCWRHAQALIFILPSGLLPYPHQAPPCLSLFLIGYQLAHLTSHAWSGAP